MTKTCLVCGVVFEKKQRESGRYWKEKKYCSRTCSIKRTSVSFVRHLIPKNLVPWNKGIKYNDELKKKLDLSGLEKGQGFFRGKKKPEFSGEFHPNWKGRIEKDCVFCRKKMSLPLWEAKRRNFCSSVCDKSYRKKERQKKDLRVCLSCKRQFDSLGSKRFCSKQCVSVHLAIKFKGRPSYRPKDSYISGPTNPQWKERIDRTCKTCSKIFKVRPSDLKPEEANNEKDPASFCSRKCFGLGRRGEKSPVWKGGKLSDAQYLREKLGRMPEHKEWHIAVLKRDAWKCVDCGALKGLEVHHVVSVSDIIMENGLRTTADARKCSLLWATSNGRTLCKACHRKTDSWGRRRRLDTKEH